MKNSLNVLFFLVFSIVTIQAQRNSFHIQGTVMDTLENSLLSATVVILNAKDSTLTNFGLTDDKGKFKIEGVRTGDYIVQITYLGYEQFEKEISLSSTKGDLDLGMVKLLSSQNLLDEVVIEGEYTPMMVKKDTLIYNAGAFQTRPNEVVEDLLRKMPGIEVEDDGTVIAQGEEVRQVLVDGKKFFGDDPTVATRNLPADAVEQVEVFDKLSDMAEFSGVDDGERQKTMNLQLKEGKKNGYFGNITAGYGSDDRYNGRLSLNRFNPRLQLSAIANINNVNEQGFSTSEFRSFMGSLGGFSRGGGGIPFNNGLSNGFVETEAGGINMNYQIGPKTSLNANYFLNFINNDITSKSTRENFLSEGSYYTFDDISQLSDNKNHRLFMELNHEIDSTQDIRIRTTFNLNDAKLFSNSAGSVVGTSGNKENESSRIYDTFGDNSDMQGSILYRKKFGAERNRTFTFNASLNDASDDIQADLENITVFDPDDPVLKFTEQIVQNQIQTNDQMNYTLRTSYVHPIGFGKFLEFNYRRQNFDTDLVKDVYDIMNGQEFFNKDLSNQYIRDYTLDRGGVSYYLNTENTSFTVEMSLQQSNLQGELVLENSVIEKSYFNFLPRINWRYNFARSKNLQFRYNTNIREPSLEQLQPIVDNSDPLNIYIGNPDLKAEYQHSMRMRYFNYNQFNFTSFFATITANYTTNSIVNERIIDENFVQTTTPRNVDQEFRINGNLSFGSPLNLLKTRINLTTNFGYQNNILFINTTQNDANRYNTSFQLRFENRFKKTIDLAIGGRWSYNLNTYSVNDELNQDYINQRYFTDLTYNIKKLASVSASLNYNIYSQEAFEDQQKVPLLGASISFYLLKDQKGELKITGFDLLDQNLGINRTSNLNYVEYEEILSIGRYIMVSFTYALRGMGNENSGGGRDFRRR